MGHPSISKALINKDLDILVDDQRGDHNKRTLKAFVDELTLSLDGYVAFHAVSI